MKKITNILVITILCLVVQAQEPVLSPRLKAYYRIKMEMSNLYSEFSWAENRTKDSVAMREILVRYEENRQRLQQFPEYFRPSWDARNYADMLAVFGRYAEAVALYDTAFYHRQMEAYDFNLPYRRAYFAGDTLLHQRKLVEYQQAECGLYSYNEWQGCAESCGNCSRRTRWPSSCRICRDLTTRWRSGCWHSRTPF